MGIWSHLQKSLSKQQVYSRNFPHDDGGSSSMNKAATPQITQDMLIDLWSIPTYLRRYVIFTYVGIGTNPFN